MVIVLIVSEASHARSDALLLIEECEALLLNEECDDILCGTYVKTSCVALFVLLQIIIHISFTLLKHIKILLKRKAKTKRFKILSYNHSKDYHKAISNGPSQDDIENDLHVLSTSDSGGFSNVVKEQYGVKSLQILGRLSKSTLTQSLRSEESSFKNVEASTIESVGGSMAIWRINSRIENYTALWSKKRLYIIIKHQKVPFIHFIQSLNQFFIKSTVNFH